MKNAANLKFALMNPITEVNLIWFFFHSKNINCNLFLRNRLVNKPQNIKNRCACTRVKKPVKYAVYKWLHNLFREKKTRLQRINDTFTLNCLLCSCIRIDLVQIPCITSTQKRSPRHTHIGLLPYTGTVSLHRQHHRNVHKSFHCFLSPSVRALKVNRNIYSHIAAYCVWFINSKKPHKYTKKPKF